MKLWVRSQDRMNLVQIKQISINYANKTQIIANCLPEYYERSGNYYELLGTYKTKERALEVLDEIQEILKPKMVYKNITKDTTGIESINQCFENNIHFNTNNNADIHFINNTYVYEMPKE